jgi:hypothetical protein
MPTQAQKDSDRMNKMERMDGGVWLGGSQTGEPKYSADRADYRKFNNE